MPLNLDGTPENADWTKWRQRAAQNDVSQDLSAIGRLLRELSWSGRSIRAYRDGGLGVENVLTVEVLQGLDFLPRAAFLGAVIAAAHDAPAARAKLVGDSELAKFTLLPNALDLDGSDARGEQGPVVYPDALLVSPGCFAVVEAKRIRSSSFQTEQLAREFVLAAHAAGGKTPLLLLILGAAPPVLVEGCGRLSIQDAIASQIRPVLRRIGREHEAESLIELIPPVVTWTTWHEVASVVQSQCEALDWVEPSLRSCIERLADSVAAATSRHS